MSAPGPTVAWGWLWHSWRRIRERWNFDGLDDCQRVALHRAVWRLVTNHNCTRKGWWLWTCRYCTFAVAPRRTFRRWVAAAAYRAMLIENAQRSHRGGEDR